MHFKSLVAVLCIKCVLAGLYLGPSPNNGGRMGRISSYSEYNEDHFKESTAQKILTSLNDIDNKINKLVQSQQKLIIYNQDEENSKLVLKCSNIKVVEDQDLYDEPIREPRMLGCEDLDQDRKSGVYFFGTDETNYNLKNRSYNERYCLIRDDGSWTVLQRRDNFSSPQNFNLSWFDYKHGFGNLHKDFWFGNEFISRFSAIENDLLLRIELEDFKGNFAWAEYSVFKVFAEEDDFRLIVGEYKGIASDSFSSHNNTFFSTFDRKNDQAPQCCPCAVSYGGGWWFNSCFESNLNGIYYKNPKDNGYYGGIIWENWLGDYSLKKSVIMAKPIKRKTIPPFYEDP